MYIHMAGISVPAASCIYSVRLILSKEVSDSVLSLLTIYCGKYTKNIYIRSKVVHFDTLVSVVTLLGSGNLTTNCAPFCNGLGPLFSAFGLGTPT